MTLLILIGVVLLLAERVVAWLHAENSTPRIVIEFEEDPEKPRTSSAVPGHPSTEKDREP